MLVEREPQLAALLAHAEQAAAGRGQLVLLAGEAGIGKTSLVEELARRLAGRFAMRRGYADDLTTARPLGAIIDALPELFGDDTREPADRRGLLHAVRACLATEPTLLLLEDGHWADEATLDVVRFLGRRLRELHLLAVLTFRPEDAGRRHRLTGVLGDLAGRPGVSRLALDPLSPAGVRAVVAVSGPAAATGLDAAEVHARTGGNPFFVSEVVASPSGQLPESVRDAVWARLDRLSESGRTAVAAAAVLGPRTEIGVVCAVAGQPIEALDECLDRGLLVRLGSQIGFRHELARLAVLESISLSTRHYLHSAALSELGRREPADDRALAYHAVGCGALDAAVHHARRAGRRAAELGAHREAAAQFRTALATGRLSGTERAEVLEALSYECYLTDQLAEALTARRQAADAFERAGDRLALGRSLRWLSRLSWFLGRNPDSERYARRAVAVLEPLGDGPELAMAASNVAQLRMLAGEVEPAVEWGRRALDIAGRVGAVEAEIHALNNIGAALAGAGHSPDGTTSLRESRRRALEIDAPEHVARAYTNLGSTAAGCWRLVEARSELAAGIAYCEDRDLDSWSRYMRAWLAGVLAELGEYDEAERIGAEVLSQADLSPVSRIPVVATLARIRGRRGQAPDGSLAEVAALALGTAEKQRLVPVALAQLELAWLGHPDQLDEAVVEAAWAAAVAHPHPWELGELCWWFDALGRPRSAPVAVAEPFARRGADSGQAARSWRAASAPGRTALALAQDPGLGAAREALEITTRLGLPGVAAAVARDRRNRGWPLPRGPRAANRDHPGALTERELEVLTLVASGLSNVDVATALHVSDKTVGHHMSAVLRKLGQPTRSRAVAYALREGIVRQT